MINYVTWISALMNSQILGYQNSFRPSPFGYFCQHPCVLETGRWIYTKAPYSGSKTQGLLCFPYSFRMISNPLPCNVPLFSIFLMFHGFQWSQLPKPITSSTTSPSWFKPIFWQNYDIWWTLSIHGSIPTWNIYQNEIFLVQFPTSP